MEKIMIIFITLAVIIGIGLYALSIARFKKSFFWELIFLIIGIVIVIPTLFGVSFLETPLPILSETEDSLSSETSSSPSETSTSVRNPKLISPEALPIADPYIEQLITEKEAEPHTSTAPVITITYPQDGAIFGADTKSIDVLTTVTDDNDPHPIIEGTGTVTLKKGYNPIIVTAVDADGNASHQFVIVERQ